MDQPVPLDLEPPGTVLYTPELALAGHRLTRFGLSLRRPENRDAFLADERRYMDDHGLTAAEVDLVSDRDWTGMLHHGGHLQAIVKIAATVGLTLWDVGAHNVGVSTAELQQMCPRHIRATPGEAEPWPS